MALHAEEIVGLARLQAEDLAQAVEWSGTELGSLLDSLMGLISRHAAEAEGRPECPIGDQLLDDHRTMLRFESALLVARQGQDRLRQRVEHLSAALALLSARSPPFEGDLAASVALFPLSEEREICERAFAVTEYAPEEPAVEVFE
jgi:hypothetical protein